MHYGLRMPVPDDRRYSPDHHWVQVDGDLLRVGLTDFAQDALGEVTMVQFGETGSRLEAGAEMGEVEAFKAMTDLYIPVDATLVEINEKLADSPAIVNGDPYGDGWLCRIRADRADALDALLDAGAYGRLIGVN